MPCDVTKDEDIARVFSEVGAKFGKLNLLLHSVAFAPKEALEGLFINTSREAYRISHDISAYSLVAQVVQVGALSVSQFAEHSCSRHVEHEQFVLAVATILQQDTMSLGAFASVH